MTDPRAPAVVLTADRSLMARFPVLLDGMLCASQTTAVPAPVVRGLLAPPVRRDGLRARRGPLGLRRVEAALVRGGWDPADVAIVRPEELAAALGPRTRVIGLSSGDPLGLGMNSTTMAAVAGGQPHTSRWFQRLCRQVAARRGLAPQARVVMGGPGAWQLAGDAAARRRLGLDHVVSGYCEGNVAELVGRMADGEPLAPVLKAQAPDAAGVPAVRGATVMGSVEISRGCGLGCRFCTLAHAPMVHLPAATVLADVEANLAAGAGSLALISEDVFRYGGSVREARPEALLALLRSVRSLAGRRLIQTDHANIVTVAQFTDDQLREARDLLVGDGPAELPWVNLGVETAAGRLLAANGGQGKMEPFSPDQWADVCQGQLRRLARAGFFPLVSLVLGLPGETPADVARTAEWVAELRDERVAIFPLLHAPVDGGEGGLDAATMTAAHWRLFGSCYERNARWLPRLVWDHQRAADVGLSRRLLLQGLGRVQAAWWRLRFAWRGRGAQPAAPEAVARGEGAETCT